MDDISSPRIGLVAGSGGASSAIQIEAADITRSKGPKRVGPYAVPKAMGSTVSAVLSTALIINEFSGNDTTSIFLKNSLDSTLYWYLVLGNSVYTRSDTMSGDPFSYPEKINVVGTQFNGVVDFQIIKR